MPRPYHTTEHQLLIAAAGFRAARSKLAEARTLRGTAFYLPTIGYARELHRQAMARRQRVVGRLNGASHASTV